jgi:hypothetical protein
MQHGTCPSCRHMYLDIRPPTDSDDESDGGEYIPDEDDIEFEDAAFEPEAFSSEVEELENDPIDDLEMYMAWEGPSYPESDGNASDIDWDADASDFYSEGDFSMDMEAEEELSEDGNSHLFQAKPHL